VLNGKVDPAVPQSALAQMTAMVAGGMPIATIASQLATEIAQSVPNGNPDSASTLTKILTTALSPPGKAPPTTTAAQQVAALARRLTTIVTVVAREAENAGQQNDLSGSILDANAAKEIPASQKSAPISNGIDAGTLAESLLSQIVAQLQSGSSVPATATAAPAMASSAVAANAAAVSTIGSRPTLRTPQAPDQSSENPDPSQSAPASATTTSGSAADLLGRMIARAASVDARLNGSTPTPNALFARLIQTAAQASQTSGGSSSAFSWDQLHRFDKATALTGKTSNSTNATVAVGTAPSNAPTDTSANKATTQTAPVPYDPEAVIAQIVRGLSVRTADGAQEIRLSLQPEHLGDVSLKLTVDGNSVSATATAQNADVANTLSSNQHQLARAFADVGLKLTSFSVDVSGGNTPQQHRDSTQGFGRRFVVHETTDAATETDLDASPTFGPPTATPSAGLLNQLA
jgi:flagellar hook-length control protein FliK